jgi:hypothetical protein
MQFLTYVLLFLHLVGMASLVGGFLVQLSDRARVVNNAMFHGILTQVVSGALLVGVLEARDDVSVLHAKIGVKAAVALVVLGLVLVGRRKQTISEAMYYGIGGLALADVAVAAFWH